MYDLQYWIALIICNLITPKIVVQTKEVIVKDINGLMPGDIERIEAMIDKKPYRLGDSLEQTAYKQGQWDLLSKINMVFIGR